MRDLLKVSNSFEKYVHLRSDLHLPPFVTTEISPEVWERVIEITNDTLTLALADRLDVEIDPSSLGGECVFDNRLLEDVEHAFNRGPTSNVIEAAYSLIVLWQAAQNAYETAEMLEDDPSLRVTLNDTVPGLLWKLFQVEALLPEASADQSMSAAQERGGF